MYIGNNYYKKKCNFLNQIFPKKYPQLYFLRNFSVFKNKNIVLLKYWLSKILNLVQNLQQ